MAMARGSGMVLRPNALAIDAWCRASRILVGYVVAFLIDLNVCIQV